MSSYTFLFKQGSPQARQHLTPVRWMQHSSLLLGERTVKNSVPGTPQESGYQAMRLATELFPATFAMIGVKNISPFWSVLFYFVLIMFGIGQQVCIFFFFFNSGSSVEVLLYIFFPRISLEKNEPEEIGFFLHICRFKTYHYVDYFH